MVLLSQMIRSQAIHGDPGVFFQRVAGRQGGAWAERTVAAAAPHRRPRPPAGRHAAAAGRPRSGPPADRDAELRALTDLHARGALTDAEFDELRGRRGL